ncbi:hypothetical protein B9Z55_000441 [Caenorhabditis nigoni]|uniref:Uncharacterized protein n=1 Tax=Caenorhabditis nigoni TaxID=1611254 RepID=A0A2G5VT56_9PELO|nr:hypothetical protein B9Z55_000441 [Caenorhabditis nigoni]
MRKMTREDSADVDIWIFGFSGSRNLGNWVDSVDVDIWTDRQVLASKKGTFFEKKLAILYPRIDPNEVIYDQYEFGFKMVQKPRLQIVHSA